MSRLLDSIQNPKLLRLSDAGSTRTEGGTEGPSPTSMAFGMLTSFQDRMPDQLEPAKTADTGDGYVYTAPQVQPRLYDVKSGDPRASGLFSTDNLDPRGPDSSAWRGNHVGLGRDLSYQQQINKAFNDLTLPSANVMESSHDPPDPISEKTAGALAARKRFLCR